jgi:hypothetical protein
LVKILRRSQVKLTKILTTVVRKILVGCMATFISRRSEINDLQFLSNTGGKKCITVLRKTNLVNSIKKKD